MTEWLVRAKQKCLMLFTAYIGVPLLHLLYRTCKIVVEDKEGLHALGKSTASILMLWHNRLVMVPLLGKILGDVRLVAVVSKARDGQLLSAIASRYPNASTISVSHNARHQALRDIVKQLKNEKGFLIITPDGPRGPSYKVKPGVVFASLSSNCPVIPLSWTADRFWQLNSWDKFLIPKPFAKIHIKWGPVISHEVLSSNLDESAELLENALNHI